MAKFRIRELAEAAGIETAAELSRKANIGQATAYNLWKGSTYQPNVDTLLAIAGVFGVLVDDLIVKHDPDESAKIKHALRAAA